MSDSSHAPKTEVATILRFLRAGGGAPAADRLFALIHDELHAVASATMYREYVEHTLKPTTLVHEVFLRLVDQPGAQSQNRAHFLGVAARAMRQILVDHARRRSTERREGGWGRVTLDDGATFGGVREIDVLELDDVLQRFAALDERAARVVEQRVFGGMTVNESAEVLGVSPRSVDNDWSVARMWLGRGVTAAMDARGEAPEGGGGNGPGRGVTGMMDARRFARIKNVVMAARDFEGPLREALLERVCGEDRALRAEVLSLLEHDTEPPPEVKAGGVAEPSVPAFAAPPTPAVTAHPAPVFAAPPTPALTEPTPPALTAPPERDLTRRDSWRLRSSKFIQKRRLGLTAAAALFLALVGISATLAIRSARVARERDRALAAEAKARTEADTAAKVSKLLAGLFETAGPDRSRGESITVREVLDRGAERVRAELKGQPVVQARLMDTIGQVYHGLGLYKESRALQTEALEIRRSVLGPQDVEVARSLDRLGTVTHDTGEYDDSEAFYREALTIRRAALGDSSSEVAESMIHLAVTLQAKGDLTAAEPLYRAALALRRRFLGNEHVETARAMNSLAWCLHQRGRYAEAEPFYREAIAMQRRLLGEGHPDVAATLENLAGVRWHRGDYSQAETLWREALQIYRMLYPDGHMAVSGAEYNVARALRSGGKLAEAERYARSSLASSRTLVGTRHPYYADHLYGLGVLLSEQGRTDEAAPLLWRALELRRELLGADHPATAAALEAMGDLRLRQGQGRVAQRYFAEARAVRGARQRPDHPDQAIPLLGLARVRLRLGDALGADSLAATALTIRRVALGEGHPLVREAETLRRETGSRLPPHDSRRLPPPP